MTAPAAKMSDRWSTAWPRSCSGARYLGVPTTRPRWVRRVSTASAGPTSRARPKSSSFTPWRVRKMLAGLRSRWIRPRSCTEASVSTTVRAIGAGFVKWQGAAHEPVGERLAVEQLHHEVVHAVLVADVVNGADVRVVQRGDGAGLALEPAPAIRVCRDLARQHLDGDAAPQPIVVGTIDLAHAAFAERGDDLIGAEPGAGFERHVDNIIIHGSRVHGVHVGSAAHRFTAFIRFAIPSTIAHPMPRPRCPHSRTPRWFADLARWRPRPSSSAGVMGTGVFLKARVMTCNVESAMAGDRGVGRRRPAGDGRRAHLRRAERDDAACRWRVRPHP